MKVVDSEYKIDLHIHSVNSREKDKGKVAFNTLGNISVLAKKLNENAGTVVHVIAILEDKDEEKIRVISSYLVDENGNAAYDSAQAFSEEKFLGILRSIDMDTVLIAHQKCTLSTTHPYKNDAKMVSERRFNMNGKKDKIRLRNTPIYYTSPFARKFARFIDGESQI